MMQNLSIHTKVTGIKPREGWDGKDGNGYEVRLRGASLGSDAGIPVRERALYVPKEVADGLHEGQDYTLNFVPLEGSTKTSTNFGG